MTDTPMLTVTTEDHHDVVMVRHFDARPALVWLAFTQAEHMAQWWGPSCFTARAEMDVRPGGAYVIDMIGPDGSVSPMKGHYIEVIEHKRLVFDFDISEHGPAFNRMLRENYVAAGGGVDDPLGTRNTITVTFEDEGHGTRLTFRQGLATAAERDAYVKMGTAEGYAESCVKLDKLLASMQLFFHG
ncbi:SRPBCC domain-containing protein [Asticcacaulis sp. BYS171W]|uniref:SRPBCC domain-containing protein n=1 Tax=Asticcacaulis aquaticus TaxID=2984212 RepID=A0ABT5HRD2_9CAUL|nr:SRPBCC domain-containing protein [Asticcacaulis aquaticus]MDC7682631.1 SRPBCC domain-containing protein [Asticcacaulis aquaticus]